jgi:hypothetical protein
VVIGHRTPANREGALAVVKPSQKENCRVQVALIVLTLTVPSAVFAESDSCGTSPFLDDSMSKEQRVDVLLNRARACVREGKPIQSIALFSELIGVQPENLDAYLNRGSAYMQTGQFEFGMARPGNC